MSVTTITNLSKFNESLPKYDVVVVMAKAEWCGHCQTTKPIFEKAFAQTKCNNVMSYYLDSEKSREIIEALPVKVEGYPTLLRFRKGKFDKQFAGKREVLNLSLFMCGKN
jgi:thiol-disulfide isomerase/thioredoxin